jgi:transcription initiation factor TFIIF subunit alpha
VITNEPAIVPQPNASQSRSSSQQPPSSTDPNRPAAAAGTSQPGSRAVSPNPPGVPPNGHSLVAKRATSPRPPKPKISGSINNSRASSPLAQDARANSPTSPRPATNATSPGGANKNVNGKRRAEDGTDANGNNGAANGDQPRPPKKRKVASAVDAQGNPIELTEQMVIDWLRTTENATTHDCITYFKPFHRDKAAKENFTKLIKEVASLKGGVLTLRSQYRNGGNATAGAGGSA